MLDLCIFLICVIVTLYFIYHFTKKPPVFEPLHLSSKQPQYYIIGWWTVDERVDLVGSIILTSMTDELLHDWFDVRNERQSCFIISASLKANLLTLPELKDLDIDLNKYDFSLIRTKDKTIA